MAWVIYSSKDNIFESGGTLHNKDNFDLSGPFVLLSLRNFRV